MPNQNFFDKNDQNSAIIVEEDILESKPKGKTRNPAIVFTIVIVLIVAGIFVWVMSLPPKPVEDAFQTPEALVNATPMPPVLEESSTQGESTSQSVQNVDDIPRDEWYLRLVNAENPLPDDYGEQEMTAFGGGYYFDERILDDLESMLDAAKEDGVKLRIESGYRGVNRQTTRNKNEIAAYKNRGYSEEDAIVLANMEEPPYLQCEHSLGLAVDLMDSGSKGTSIAFEETDEFEWLQDHAAEYGFILRYPEDKVEITGMVYEPWHFRYVGVEQAQKIKESGLCLEEYLEQ